MADNYTVINSCSQIITMKSKDVGAGVEAVQSIPTDTAGTPMLVLSGSAVTSSMSAMVAAISSLSALFNVSIASSANAANVVGASSVPTSSMGAVVTSLRPDSPGIITTGTAGSPSSVFLSVQGASNGTPLPVFQSAAANGGASNLLIFTSSAAVAAGTVKASSAAGTVYGFQGINISSIPIVLKLYDAISTAVAVGTTVPKYALPIPCIVTTGSGCISPFPAGIAFSNAITYAITANAWSSDSTAVVAGGTINIQYA